MQSVMMRQMYRMIVRISVLVKTTKTKSKVNVKRDSAVFVLLVDEYCENSKNKSILPE